jgi:hypothetical protein
MSFLVGGGGGRAPSRGPGAGSSSSGAPGGPAALLLSGAAGGGGGGAGGGDETFLEAFVESVSTLPHEAKRSLELLRDLDARSGAEAERLLRLQNEYLEEAERKMMGLEVVVKERAAKKRPRPERERGSEEEGGAGEAQEQEAPGERSYFVGIRVLGGGESAGGPPREVVVPTTMELEQYLHQEQPGSAPESTGSAPESRYDQILDLQEDLLQLADEKVAVARQLRDRLDGIVARLDRDLVEMERLLQVRSEKRGREQRKIWLADRFLPLVVFQPLLPFTPSACQFF